MFCCRYRDRNLYIDKTPISSLPLRIYTYLACGTLEVLAVPMCHTAHISISEINSKREDQQFLPSELRGCLEIYTHDVS